MRKTIKFLFVFLLFLLLLSGCSNDTNHDLFQFKDSYVGDNHAVGNIINQLPGADHLSSFELKTNEEPYGIILHYNWTESEKAYKESVIYQATFLFALIQNVDWITFHSETNEYTMTKQDLQNWYGEDLSLVEGEDELRERIEENLKDEIKVNHFLNGATVDDSNESKSSEGD